MATAIWSAGCTGSGSEHRNDEDSASVPVVAVTTAESMPSLDLRATSLPGEQDPAEARLFRVVGAATLADGGYVVANNGTDEVLVFDSRGDLKRTIGRSGQGPGEFQRLTSLARITGDTIAVHDGVLRRITILTPDGVVDEIALGTPPAASASGLSGLIGPVSGDGRFALWTTVRTPDVVAVPLKAGHLPLQVFVIDSSGQNTNTELGLFHGEEVFIGESSMSNWGEAPFARWTRFGVHEGRIIVVRSDLGEWQEYEASGRMERIYRPDWPLREVTDEDRRIHTEEWLDRFYAMGTRADRRRRFQQAEYPETMPAFRDVVVGNDGVVWIEPYHLWNGEARRFIGYGRDGSAIGMLVMRYTDRILEIGRGHALLLRTDDETGVERIGSVSYAFRN